MVKRVSVFLFAFLLALSLFAQAVDRAEIESAGAGKNIVFKNYEGPHAVIDSLKTIKGIGESLAAGLEGGRSFSGDSTRYSVIRVIDPQAALGFDADIFILGKYTGVDHIRNLRVIIAGYLEQAFGYSAKDALLLAEFITIYNAVYRGNWNYFTSKYKSAVLAKLDPATAGLALSYDEWAGKTKILIPLSNPAKGSLSAVSTSSLTEPAVVQELKKADDKGVATRQEMVDLKEREVKEGQDRAAAEKARLEEEAANLARERSRLEEAKNKLEDAKKAEADKAAEARKAAESGTPETAKKAEEDSKAASAAVVEAQKEIVKAEESVAAQDQTVERRAEELKKTEEAVALKQEEVKTEREEIRKDQGETIKEENFPGAAKPPEKPGKMIVLPQANSLVSPFASLAAVDLGEHKIKSRSTLNTIRTRTLVETKSGYYAVAGTTEGSGAVRLVSIDSKSLETKAVGKDDLFIDSFLLAEGEELYAILSIESSFYLGRFGPDLAKTAQSDQSVHPFTTLVFQEEGLIVQAQDGAFYVLSRDKLATEKRIE